MKKYLVTFSDGETQIFNAEYINEVYLYFSYSDDCGNILVDPDVADIVEIKE